MIVLEVVSMETDKEHIVENLAHETLVHGYKAGDDLKSKKTTSEVQDHKALKNKDEKHLGYKKYKSAQKQLEKIGKKYIDAFEFARNRYNKKY